MPGDNTKTEMHQLKKKLIPHVPKEMHSNIYQLKHCHTLPFGSPFFFFVEKKKIKENLYPFFIKLFIKLGIKKNGETKNRIDN